MEFYSGNKCIPTLNKHIKSNQNQTRILTWTPEKTGRPISHVWKKQTPNIWKTQTPDKNLTLDTESLEILDT